MGKIPVFPYNQELSWTKIPDDLEAQDVRTGVIYPLCKGRPRGIEKRRRKGVYGARTIVQGYEFDSVTEAQWCVKGALWCKSTKNAQLVQFNAHFKVEGICSYTTDVLIRVDDILYAVDVKGAKYKKGRFAGVTATDASKLRIKAAQVANPEVLFCFGYLVKDEIKKRR